MLAGIYLSLKEKRCFAPPKQDNRHNRDSTIPIPWLPEVFSRARRTEILRFVSAAFGTGNAQEKPLAPRVPFQAAYSELCLV